MEKKSFVLYKRWRMAFESVSDADAGKLIKAIFAFQDNEELPDLPPGLAFYMNVDIIPTFTSDADKYEQIIVERNRANGKKGGRPRKQENPTEPKKPSGFSETQETQPNPKNLDNVSDNVNDNDNDNDNERDERIKRQRRFIPPTIDEVKKFFLDNQFHSSFEQFYDYYESNGWFVGKNKMKDWNAAARAWERRQDEFHPQTRNKSSNWQSKSETTKSANDPWK